MLGELKCSAVTAPQPPCGARKTWGKTEDHKRVPPHLSCGFPLVSPRGATIHFLSGSLRDKVRSKGLTKRSGVCQRRHPAVATPSGECREDLELQQSWMAIGVGPLLCCFVSELFWNHCGSVPEPFRNCSGTVPEPFQSTGVSERILNCSGPVLEP